MMVLQKWKKYLFRPIREFCGLAEGTTYFWPRWIVLRAVGLVYVLIFWNALTEARVLIGPSGIIPAEGLMPHLTNLFGGAVAAFFRAPSVFWLGAGDGAILFWSWVGMAAALAVVLNLWPRLALSVCWVVFLSFVSCYAIFSSTQMDQLMLEVALLCIPFAPAGLRPGLGHDSPPRPIVLFMVRWLLIRVMFESGLFKLLSGDPHWREFTAMDIMYETAPFPTILGYVDHNLPHVQHLFETALTFAAELLAPVLAIFAGRRGRWFAIITWTMLQAGIQLTANFGWLNFAAFGLGLVLLDDQMLAGLAKRLRLRRWHERLQAMTAPVIASPRASWRLRALRVALWLHFGIAMYDAVTVVTLGQASFSEDPNRPWHYAYMDFRSANAYTLYATFTPDRVGVEFTGSNDGGVTWRPYVYPNLPQQTDRICGFIAPRFLRFEATMQVVATLPERTSTVPLIALKLLERDPRIIALFENDPFAERPPTMMRMRRYQLKFTDWATWRETGDYWTKTYLDDYAPMFYIDASGRITEARSAEETMRVQAEQGNPAAQNYLGSAHMSGQAGARDLIQAERWFLLAAGQGFAGAEHNLGVLHSDPAFARYSRTEAARWFARAAERGFAPAQYAMGWLHEQGLGVLQNPSQAAKWYRAAAEQNEVNAQFRLGLCYYRGLGVRKDEVEALAWFTLAARQGDEDAAENAKVLAQQLGHAAVAEARERADRYASLSGAAPTKP